MSSILVVNTDPVRPLEPGPDDRVFVITPDPAKALNWSSPNIVSICALIDIGNRPLVPLAWPDRFVYAAGIHPSELYELFAEPNPPLPTPRMLIIGGNQAFETMRTLCDWYRFDALELTVADTTEAQIAADWLGAGWRIQGTQDFTVWATRLLPA